MEGAGPGGRRGRITVEAAGPASSGAPIDDELLIAPLGEREQRSLRAVAEVVVPGGTPRLPWSGRDAASDDLLEELRRPRSRHARLGVRLILALIDLVAVLGHGRTVGNLELACRERYLGRWIDGAWPARMAFRAVASLITLHYFARPEVHAALGYDAEAVRLLPPRPGAA